MSSEDDRAEAVNMAEQCLAALRAGDREGDRSLLVHEAISHIVCAFDAQLGRVAYKFLSNVSDTQDAVQECYSNVVKTLREGRNLPQPGSLTPWLLKVLTNACCDQLGRRRRQVALANLDDVTELTDKYAARAWIEAVAKYDPLNMVVEADLDDRIIEAVKVYFERKTEEGREWEIEVIRLRCFRLKPAAICDMLNSDGRYNASHPATFERKEIYRAIEGYSKMIRAARRKENEE